MNTSWQTETGHLRCRWFESSQSLQRTAPLFEEASESRDRSVSPGIPDFARHSPFGSGEWFAPWNVRWSLPGKN
jgi:hypothetical protein